MSNVPAMKSTTMYVKAPSALVEKARRFALGRALPAKLSDYLREALAEKVARDERRNGGAK